MKRELKPSFRRAIARISPGDCRAYPDEKGIETHECRPGYYSS